MRSNGEYVGQKLGALGGAVLAGGLALSACSPGERSDSPPPPPDTYIAPIETVTTLCVDVTGFDPFDTKTCGRLAGNVEAGFLQVSELTDNVIEPPNRFTHRILPEFVKLDDAAERRCINLYTATEEETARVEEITNQAVAMALKSEAVGPNEAVVIGVNSPVSKCGATPGKWQEWLMPPTDRCVPPPPDQVGYVAARAMIDQVPHAAIFTYTGENTKLGDTVKIRDIAHEQMHVGEKRIRPAHELGFCSNKSDSLPTVWGPEHVMEIRANIRKPDASIMSYSRDYDKDNAYIAPPQLLYLDVIKQNQVIAPRKSGLFALSDFSDQAAPALLRLDLDSRAVRNIIRRELPGYISPDDYEYLWVGKIPTPRDAPKNTPPSVGIYAAPGLEKSNGAPIFLLSILGPRDRSGNHWGLKNGTQISLINDASDPSTAKVRVQLAPS